MRRTSLIFVAGVFSWVILLQAETKTESGKRSLTTFSADGVLPQLIDGIRPGEEDVWSTTMVLVNLQDTGVEVRVKFWDPNGGDLTVPLEVGDCREGKQSGNVCLAASVREDIPGGGSATIQTAGGSGKAFSEGWAEIDSLYDIGVVAFFSRQLPGGVEFSTAIPISSRFDNNFVVPFDNRRRIGNSDFVTTIALVNPSQETPIPPSEFIQRSSLPPNVCMAVRDPDGIPIEVNKPEGGFERPVMCASGPTEVGGKGCDCPIRLERASRKTFFTDRTNGLGKLEGKTGVIEFFSPDAELAGLALRADRSTSDFISLHALTTIGK